MAFLGTVQYDYNGAGFSRHANFETAFRAISTLVRMSTGDSWTALLADAVHNPHVPGVTPPLPFTNYFFFVFYMGFMGWVLVSIFVAIVLEYFNDSNAEEGVSIKYDDIESFQRKWLEFDVKNSSYIRTVDLGLLLYACKPPLVGVAVEHDGFFANSQPLRRPRVDQLEQLLVELDVPEHDGSIHFLELLLALLQRVTGVVNEEKIMCKLLSQHPTYVKSIKHMAPITGSTADPYIREDVMSHLKRGLEATGLLFDSSFNARGSSFKAAAPPAGGETKALSFKNVAKAASFKKKVSAEGKAAAAEEKDLNNRRASLARVATSNKLQRDVIEQLNQAEAQKRNRGSIFGSMGAAFAQARSASAEISSAADTWSPSKPKVARTTPGPGARKPKAPKSPPDPLSC